MDYFNQRMIVAVVAIVSFIMADEVMMRFFEEEILFGEPNVYRWVHLLLFSVAVVGGVYAVFGPIRIRRFFQFVNQFFG